MGLRTLNKRLVNLEQNLHTKLDESKKEISEAVRQQLREADQILQGEVKNLHQKMEPMAQQLQQLHQRVESQDWIKVLARRVAV